MGLGALSLLCFSLGCLSKGAALSFAAFPAAVEFLLVTAPPTPPAKGCARTTAAAVVAVAARQLPALCVAVFVARRTLSATEAQTTCGFANDSRKLGPRERWIAAAAAPLRHLARFIYPVDNAVEVGKLASGHSFFLNLKCSQPPRAVPQEYYPKEHLATLPAFVAAAALSGALTAWAVWRMGLRLLVTAGQLQRSAADHRLCGAGDAVAAAWLIFFSLLSPSLGLFGTGDHLCYINAGTRALWLRQIMCICCWSNLMYSLCLLAFVRDLDRYSYIASAAVLPSALAALLAACALPSGALSPRVGPRSTPRDRRRLAAALCALLSLLCCAATPALQCFRSDVRHYSRALGRRDKRAFPHYLLGLSHQRAAEKANGQASVVESAHRSAVKALTLAEALAPGWLNLAAARAESFAALNDHESAGTSSAKRTPPAVSFGALSTHAFCPPASLCSSLASAQPAVHRAGAARGEARLLRLCISGEISFTPAV
jgi:hypothetical protein